MRREQQELLTRVGAGTPMGDLLRRYWFPVAVSAELGCAAAQAVRLLGEDLVLFRTSGGRLGLIGEHCTHRGSSMRCGRVDVEGISCPHHGWKFDVAGRCVLMPGEVPDPALLDQAATRAYAAEELGGLIFAYVGPEPRPLLPRYDLFVWEGVLRDIGRALLPCNWLQIMENSVDPTHVEFLHGHHLGAVRRERGLPAPAHYGKRHLRIGFDIFRYGIIKRRIVEGGSEQDDDWQTGHPLIFPAMLRVGAGGQHRFQIRVPVDDTHTLHFWYSCYVPPPGSDPWVQDEVPVYEVPWQDEQGRFIVDFVDGGDIMTWLSQGPIADRTRELLVSSDRGVTLLRRLLLKQIDRVHNGEDPLGVIRDPAENQIISFAQEARKFGSSSGFLREAVELSHVRYSPLKRQILELMELV